MEKEDLQMALWGKTSGLFLFLFLAMKKRKGHKKFY
jgi:hypothetical protein